MRAAAHGPMARRGSGTMKIPRRRFLQLAAGAAVVPAVTRGACAQAWPSRPVRIVVGLAAGSSPDIGARLIGQWLSERLGQQFVVDNRPGAAGNLATEAVVRALADGYTLLLAISTNAINETLYDNLGYSFIRDTAPIAGLIRVPQALVVNPSVPASSVPELIAYAKANPGKLNMVSTGVGGIPQVAGELFKMMTGIEMVTVPYRGNPRPDLVGGQVQVMFDTLPAAIELIRAGKLRALAVTTAVRQQVLPDIPTVAEFLPGYEASGWQGIVAPKATPKEIVETLNHEIDAALADAGIKAQLANLGAVPMPMTPAEFGRYIGDETGKWAKVIAFAGIKPE
jgi:tripartite-type tricarboxylate transporter receptor subunit TctC